ncbi:MAG: hypothetical protein ACK4VK_00635 [Aquificaceae bacterium]
MNLKRIIKIKEKIKDSRARELKEIDMQIDLLRKEVQKFENIAEEVNNLIKTAFSEGLLFKYRALLSQKKDLLEKIARLELIREEKKQRLMEVHKKLKALNILKEQRDVKERSRALNFEGQNTSFFHLMKRWKRDV